MASIICTRLGNQISYKIIPKERIDSAIKRYPTVDWIAIIAKGNVIEGFEAKT